MNRTDGSFFLAFVPKVYFFLLPLISGGHSLPCLFKNSNALPICLEELGANVVIPLDTEECSQLLVKVPPMSGGEYLTFEVLMVLWGELNDVFCRKVETQAGSVADLFEEYNPDVHLVGRIYFHL